jgi:GNAT superfamily N-acetyltransferase
LKGIPVIMIKNDLSEIPQFSMPAGFIVKTYRSGDEKDWARIEQSVGEFKNRSEALKHFKTEFGPFISDFRERCFFIETEGGEKIGTATAWYNENFLGRPCGRLHWVAIVPEYQGKKLGKPLVQIAMEKMKKFHDCAYLTTQTSSQRAVRIYLDFGFVPYIENTESLRGWQILASRLKHPELKNLVKNF